MSLPKVKTPTFVRRILHRTVTLWSGTRMTNASLLLQRHAHEDHRGICHTKTICYTIPVANITCPRLHQASASAAILTLGQQNRQCCRAPSQLGQKQCSNPALAAAAPRRSSPEASVTIMHAAIGGSRQSHSDSPLHPKPWVWAWAWPPVQGSELGRGHL